MTALPESLTDVRMFVAVYEERSFTEAAKREHATQSGVSQHVQNLEEQLGTKLFMRKVGIAVQPTPAGDAYYPAAIDLLKACDRARRAVQPFGTGLSGKVQAGLVPTVARSLLGPAAAKFTQANPNVTLRFVEAPSSELIKQVRAAELDFAIAMMQPGELGVKSSFLASTPCFLASGRKAGLTHLAPVRIADLGPIKLVAPSAPSAVRKQVEAYVALNGAVVEHWLELNSVTATLDLVAKTEWMTIMPAFVLLASMNEVELTISPLGDTAPIYEVVVIEPLRCSLNAEAALFLETLRAEAALFNERVDDLLGTRPSLQPETPVKKFSAKASDNCGRKTVKS